MATTKRKTAAQKHAAQQRATKASFKSFYDTTQTKERDDKKAMMSLITSIKDVIKRHRAYIDGAIHAYAAAKEEQKKIEQEEQEYIDEKNEESSEEEDDEERVNDIEDIKEKNQKIIARLWEECDVKLACCIRGLVEFDYNWLGPFMYVYEGELQLLSGYDPTMLNKERDDDIDNRWLPSVRSTLMERKIDIPPIFFSLSKTYALLTLGYKYFADELRGPHLRVPSNEANAFGSNYVWDEDLRDPNRFRMFLSAPEPYYSLQVYSRQNFILHNLPPAMGGGMRLTTENKNKLISMRKWLDVWAEARGIHKRKNQGNVDDMGTYQPPRKKKYTERTYKLDAERYYMKCPGCDYIVVFPKPLPAFVKNGIKRKDGSEDSLWLIGKGGAHKLDLNNCQFNSDFKKKHSYKVLQSHVARCEKCTFLPDCFGKPRQQQEPATKQEEAEQIVQV